jgi:hypothetical protein
LQTAVPNPAPRATRQETSPTVKLYALDAVRAMDSAKSFASTGPHGNGR